MRGARLGKRWAGKNVTGLRFAVLVCATVVAAPQARGAGTPAGTAITNSATIAYTTAGVARVQVTAPATLTVDDKVSFTLTPADAADVSITAGGRGYLSYLLTNTGNGLHDFALSAAVAGSAPFAPAAGPAFFADTAGAAALPVDGNAGVAYVAGLAADASRAVYLQITAPPQLQDGQSLGYLVTAEAYQPGTLGLVNPPVKSSARAGADLATDKSANPMARLVVLADGHGNGGDSDRDGRYSVVARDGSGNILGFRARSASVTIVKAATVTDLLGGSQPMVGATIRYTLAVSASGSGSARGVVITDAIPENTSYRPGTLTLNGAALTDAADGDAGDVGGTTAGVVTVRLGELTAGSAVQNIAFEVKIN